MALKMYGICCHNSTSSKLLYLLHNVYVILGSVYFIKVRTCLRYVDNATKQFDSDLYLVIALSCIGVSGGIASLFIDCTGKRYKTLLCLVLWNTFQGTCMVLSLSNIFEGTSMRNRTGMEFAALIVYITGYATLCVAEIIFVYKENRHSKTLHDSDLV